MRKLTEKQAIEILVAAGRDWKHAGDGIEMKGLRSRLSISPGADGLFDRAEIEAFIARDTRAEIESGEYPVFTVRDRGELFDVDLRDGTHVSARSGEPSAARKAAGVARELNALMREHGERGLTEVHSFGSYSLGGIIADEIRQAAYERVSIPPNAA